ncbi:thioredoxin-2 [Drosophila guanche]|uniref:Blast:Thioredoxin-T n=1 Tax=Drosophila guanche TaxID=7266 RepID=A0A3B0JL16_DROGU|nr:thioredoxin-2 [Drosophila guanche]SPP76060.1 blast:Thioredoxin-T [Drosophila guanche]
MASAPKKVIVVESKTNFDSIIGGAGNKHILVEFYATWCGPCALIGPRLEQMANEYAGRMLILKIDVDDHEELAIEYEVTSMPTFLIIKNKVTLAQFVGSNAEKVESTVEKFVGKPEGNKTDIPERAGTSHAVAEAAKNALATGGAEKRFTKKSTMDKK